MRNRISTLLLMLLSIAVLSSCEEWTSLKSLEITTERQYDKEGWKDYCASLRAYKQDGSHYLTYLRLDNAPAVQESEKSSMRSFPDSIDFVSLTNADNFSRADAEDMALMKEMGTKVLYRLDLASRESADEASLSAYLDAVIASVRANGLDGYSFSGKAGDAMAMSSMIVEKLAGAKFPGQVLVFEGDPSFIAEENIGDVDFFVLDTESAEYVQDIAIKVTAAASLGIHADKIVLAASVGATIKESSVEKNAVDAVLDCVVSDGPFRGMAFYDIGSDYYHYEGNWLGIRSAIERLNPSK